MTTCRMTLPRGPRGLPRILDEIVEVCWDLEEPIARTTSPGLAMLPAEAVSRRRGDADSDWDGVGKVDE